MINKLTLRLTFLSGITVLCLQPAVSQSFQELTGISLPGVYGSTATWGDYDNDGDPDLMISGATGTLADYKPIIRIYKNNGNSTFTHQTGIALTAVCWGSIVWGDYDNDSDLDILLTGLSGSGPVSKIYKNNGDNTFTHQTGISITAVYNSSVAWEDYDNDGYLDILLTGYTNSAYVSKIYKNNGDNTFSEQTGISLTGVGYSSVAWGDYNNDGYPDILLTGYTGSSPVSRVYKNNGDNTFTLQAGIALTGVYFGSSAWGDYDNDGDLDIVLTGQINISNYISRIYKNNGDNTFTHQSGITLPGVVAGSVAWGDYNNDGYQDLLLTGKTSSSRISKIFKNNGNNTFSDQTGITLTGVDYSSVAWGDYDLDGDLDLLMNGGYETARVSKIYKNLAGISNTVPSVPANLQNMADGHKMILTWEKSLDSLTPQSTLSYNLYVSDESARETVKAGMAQLSGGYRKVVQPGNTQFMDRYAINLKRFPGGTRFYWSVQAVDNGFEGSPFATEQSFIKPVIRPTEQAHEMIQTGGMPTTVSVMWTNGNGYKRLVFVTKADTGASLPRDSITYRANVQYGLGSQIDSSGWYCVYNGHGNSVTITGLEPMMNYRVMVAEYDGIEGLEQYYTLADSNNAITTETSYFEEQTGISLAGIRQGSVAWGDYDNDGDRDILLTGYGNTERFSAIYRNNGDNTFTEQTGISLTAVAYSSSAWGDYDLDGYLDILLTGFSSSGYISKIYKNNGDSTFTEQTDIVLTGVFSSSVAWCDYDNDGDPDILLTGYSSSVPVSKIYRNDGHNTFTEQTGISLTGVGISSVAWGDYDNDGWKDILLTGWTGSAGISKIYRNNSDNTFTEQTGILLTNISGGSVDWGDYDNDGDLDILLTGENDLERISKIYKNNGDNTFSEQTGIVLPGITASSVAWSDYDNDGDLDILLTGRTSSVRISKIYANNNDNTFSEQTGITLCGVNESSVAWCDYDNDGDVDFILSGYTGSAGVSKIYQNLLIIQSKIDQNITFDSIPPKTFGEAGYDLTAFASSGLPVSFTISDTSVAVISGNALIIKKPGIAAIKATQDGNYRYSPAPDITRSLVVNKADQSITFDTLAGKTFGDTAFLLIATASSGLPVSFTSSDSSVVTLNGDTAMVSGAGAVIITASQPGNEHYKEAQAVTRSLNVARADQTISFDTVVNKTFNDPAFVVSANASSGLSVSFSSSDTTVMTVSGNRITIKGPGTTLVTASQAGNEDYNAAPDVIQSVTVVKADQSITFDLTEGLTYGDVAFEIEAASSSGLPVILTSSDTSVIKITGKILTIAGAGTSALTISQVGNENYNAAADVVRSVTVAKADQIITFEVPADKTFGDSPFEPVASASSGLPLTFCSSDTTVACVQGNMVTITGAGTTTITASQEGNDNFNAAIEVVQNLIVHPLVSVQNAGVHPVMIYPNPTDDRLYITTDVIITQVEIISMTGETILLETDEREISHLSLRHLTAGIYLLKIKVNDKVILYRIMKE